jgi:hypothetical protein
MHLHRTLLAVLVPFVVIGACSGDDGGDAAPTTTERSPSTASTSTTAPDAEGWWCHPARPDDLCLTADLRTTIVDWQLTESVDEGSLADDPVADCFYVPPEGDDEEVSETIRIDAARFRTVCRVYIPSGLSGGYEAVEAGFDRYLEEAGERPFVLIGDEEGGDLVTRLVQERVAADPALAARMLSALVVGRHAVQVTNDGTPGGTFPTFPLCTSSDQTGCIITFHAFEDASPPATGTEPFAGIDPANSPACTNPAGLDGSKGQLRAATFPVETPLVGGPVVAGLPPVDTPFITLPEYYVAQCLSLVFGTVELWIGPSIDPDDQRHPGPLTAEGSAAAHAGATQHDFTLTMGDLLHIVGEQSEAYAAN